MIFLYVQSRSSLPSDSPSFNPSSAYALGHRFFEESPELVKFGSVSHLTL